MSGIRLAAPYLDTSADALSFALGLPAQEALALTRVETGEMTVELRLLGASHQVFAGPVRETVACLPDGAEALPAVLSRDFGDWHYRFTARIGHHGLQEFTRQVRRIRTTAEGRSDALCGVFPGDADAVTALAMDRGPGVGWRTWHTYPQSGHIVATHTRMEKR